MRGLVILLALALIVGGAAISIVRLQADGITTLSILGFVLLVSANRWRPTP